MKIVFSTKNVHRPSFLDTCRYAYDYGFDGFEIYDAPAERVGHPDSILRRDRAADAKRKLLNRGLSVSALRMRDGDGRPLREVCGAGGRRRRPECHPPYGGGDPPLAA